MASSTDGSACPSSNLIVLADNDIVLKFAACNLLDELLIVLGTSHDSILLLPTARFKIRKDKKLLVRYGEGGVARALEFVQSCRIIEDHDLLNRAQQLVSPGIDEGEALLMTAASIRPDSLLATGDKRSLIQLCKEPTKNLDLRKSLAGHVLCFEALLKMLIESSTVGFERVRESVVRGLLTDQPEDKRDKMLSIVFSRGLGSSEEDVVEALESYIHDLHRQTGDLLRP